MFFNKQRGRTRPPGRGARPEKLIKLHTRDCLKRAPAGPIQIFMEEWKAHRLYQVYLYKARAGPNKRPQTRREIAKSERRGKSNDNSREFFVRARRRPGRAKVENAKISLLKKRIRSAAVEITVGNKSQSGAGARPAECVVAGSGAAARPGFAKRLHGPAGRKEQTVFAGACSIRDRRPPPGGAPGPGAYRVPLGAPISAPPARTAAKTSSEERSFATASPRYFLPRARIANPLRARRPAVFADFWGGRPAEMWPRKVGGLTS